MLKMSFFNGTVNRQILTDFINTTDLPIKYTYGLGYRSPTTNKVPVTKDRALEIAKNQSLLDATEEKDCLHLNASSANDMW